MLLDGGGVMKPISTGSVLVYHTCKSFDPISGDEFDKYDIHLLVECIKTEGFHLFNLDDAKFYRVISNGEMRYLLAEGKIEVTDEVA